VAGTRRAFSAIAAHDRVILTAAGTAMTVAASGACVDSNLIDTETTGAGAECSALYLVAVA